MQGLPELGEVVDDMYEIRKQLGAGGFGAVFLARHLAMDRDVALKMLIAHGPRPEEMIERFKREVMAIRVLSHPNTVRIFDYRDSAQGLLYYTMEYLKGETLKDLTKREGPQSPRRVRHICRQVLKSLGEAHSYGIVHRDLKPANIMLVEMHGEEDFVKVLDFGIAKILDQNGENQDEDDPLTSAGMLVGTLRYMAPEQITGGQLSACTDLYSLALIMIELLSGQSVFAGTGRWEIFQRQISNDAIELTPEIMRSSLGGVLGKALQKRPEQRYASAAEMLKALDAIPDHLLDERPLSAAATSPELGASTSSGSFAPNSGLFSAAHTPAPSIQAPGLHVPVQIGVGVADDDGATIVTDLETLSGPQPLAYAPAPGAGAPSGPQALPHASPQTLHKPIPSHASLPTRQSADITAETHAPVAPAAHGATQAPQALIGLPAQQAPRFGAPDDDMSASFEAPARSRKGLIIGLPLAALLIGGLAVGYVVLSQNDQAATDPAVAQRLPDPSPQTTTQTSPQAAQADPSPGQTDQPAQGSPDQGSPPAQTPPPPQEPAAARVITIEANVPRAQVFDGERFIGYTPHELTYTQPVTLTLKLDGYEPRELTIGQDSAQTRQVELSKLAERAPAQGAPDSNARGAADVASKTPAREDKPAERQKPSARPKDTPEAKPATGLDWVDVSKPAKPKPKPKPDVPIFN